MASFNRVILVGNLTRDPELRYVSNQLAVTDIGLAVNDKRKNAQGEWVEETTFVDITFWGRTAEVVCEYLKKGGNVLVEGRLKLDTWETDGQKRSKLKVIGERMQMLGGKQGGGGGGGRPANFDEQDYSPSHSQEQYDGPPARPAARATSTAPPADDIPF